MRKDGTVMKLNFLKACDHCKFIVPSVIITDKTIKENNPDIQVELSCKNIEMCRNIKRSIEREVLEEKTDYEENYMHNFFMNGR